MKLSADQTKLLIEWLAAGMTTDQINEQAAQADEPFEVTRAMATYWRTKTGTNNAAKLQQSTAALRGLAVRENRIRKLQRLARLLEKDIFGERLWVKDYKSIGSRESAEVVELERFNAPEVDQYRGILDDIARETGGRRETVDLNNKVTFVWDMPIPEPPQQP